MLDAFKYRLAYSARNRASVKIVNRGIHFLIIAHLESYYITISGRVGPIFGRLTSMLNY